MFFREKLLSPPTYSHLFFPVLSEFSPICFIVKIFLCCSTLSSLVYVKM